MQYTDKKIKRFQSVYKEHFGDEISREEAIKLRLSMFKVSWQKMDRINKEALIAITIIIIFALLIFLLISLPGKETPIIVN